MKSTTFAKIFLGLALILLVFSVTKYISVKNKSNKMKAEQQAIASSNYEAGIFTEADAKLSAHVMIETYMEKLGYTANQWGFLIKGEQSKYFADDDTWSHLGYILWPNGEEVSYVVGMAPIPNKDKPGYDVDFIYLEVNFEKIINKYDVSSGKYIRE